MEKETDRNPKPKPATTKPNEQEAAAPLSLSWPSLVRKLTPWLMKMGELEIKSC